MAGSSEPIYVLSENEDIIRSWTYAVENKNRGEHELIVTNKRIIAIDRRRFANGTRTDRQELRNGDISSLACSAGIQTHFLAAIICCIVAVIGLVQTILNAIPGIISGSIIWGVITVLFIVLAIIFFTRKKTMLNLALYTDMRNSHALSLGASMGLKLRSKRRGKVKIKVDPVIADEIVSTIGAILLTNNR